MKLTPHQLLMGTWKCVNGEIEDTYSFWMDKQLDGKMYPMYSHKTIKSGEIIFESKLKASFTSYHSDQEHSSFLMILLLDEGDGLFRVDYVNAEKLSITKMDSTNNPAHPITNYVLNRV